MSNDNSNNGSFHAFQIVFGFRTKEKLELENENIMQLNRWMW